MDKTLNFSVFKEKIIKTNELLGVLLEKNKSLEKTQQWTQQLKLKLELSKNEINKLKLRNETLTSSLKSVEKNYDSLQKEHDNLKKQFSQLENETSTTINNLQINYQLTNQQLRDCQEKLASLECPEVTKEDVKKKSPVKRKKSIKEKESEIQNDSNSDKIIAQLQSEKEKLLNEKTDLKLEVYGLKKQLSNLSQVQDDFAKLKEIQEQTKNKEQELDEIKSKYDASIKSKSEEISKLLEKIKDMEVQIEGLKEENCSYKIEISMLQESHSNHNIEEENSVGQEVDVIACEKSKTPTDNEVCQIMKQMVIPSRVSPMSNVEDIDLNIPSSQEACNFINKAQHSTDNNRSSPPCSPHLVKTVNERRILLKRKRLMARQKKKKVDLLSALVALKKANINFIISNDSLVRSSTSSQLTTTAPKSVRTKIKPLRKNHSNTFTEELSCSLDCCTNSYMLLKQCDGDEDAPLLGFFGVKNETPSLQQTCESNKTVSEPIQCHKSGKKRKRIKDVELVEETENTSSSNNTDIEHVEETVTENTSSLNSSSNTRGREIQVRRSKRKSTTSTVSVIKKPRAVTNKTLRLSAPVTLQTNEDKKTIANTANQEEVIFKDTIANPTNQEEVIFKKPFIVTKSPKTSFKRPVCSTRRSPRLVVSQHASEDVTSESSQEEKTEDISYESPQSPVQNTEDVSFESPQSPVQSTEPCALDQPVLIPLEKAPEVVQKLQPSKIEVLFNKLIVYGAEEEASNEVVREFAFQEPDYVAEAILERIAADYHDAPDTKYSPAPLMTDVQRTMLGFMSKLEKTSVVGVFDSFLTLAEQRLLTCDNLQEYGPITRLYVAICKLQKKLSRMRRLCCDVFYFCGDFAVPFLFMVLTSWTEVLPHEVNSRSMPIARVLVQIVYIKDCNKPGYNLMPLRDLLIKFYGYPTERWDVNEFFKELFLDYLRNPVRSSDFALLLYCKNRPEKWVYEKIEEHFKPIVNQNLKENFKAAVIIFIGNLYNRFSSKSEVNYLPRIREWFNGLLKDSAPDVVKRSIYLCLNRLKKK